MIKPLNMAAVLLGTGLMVATSVLVPSPTSAQEGCDPDADVCLSENVLDACAEYGLNDLACACYFHSVVEGTFDEEEAYDILAWSEDDEDYADILESCAVSNTDDDY